MALDEDGEGSLVTSLGESSQSLIGLGQEQEIWQAWAHRRFIVPHAAEGQSDRCGWTEKRGRSGSTRSVPGGHQPSDPGVLGVEALPESVGAPLEPLPV